MQKKDIKKTQGGFTLIEIIAVLVILGILAAVAVPKFIDLQGQSKKNAAMGQVAEIKSTLNLAYAKYLLKNAGEKPTGTQVLTEAGLEAGDHNIGTAPDIWNITTAVTGDVVTITVNSRGNPADTGYNETGTWTVPPHS
ncbi:type II secretion system protein [Desulfonatronum thiodismutans]|uniref:type II secretion system protein n=1 Tax=Desulfonatronum thiodismutans TaxID=159290 RepID=UPI00068BB9F3|nr:prepilin-type N-terminal cleavage/methylation domain-containing protein [Desulfonatronum thiodismutans]